MVQEFLSFIRRGNVIDLALAVILGTAFTAIVNSLVADIIMPLIGIILGGIDFTSLTIQLKDATINLGLFIQAVVNFLLIAFVLFMVVRTVNRTQATEKEAEKVSEPVEPEEILLLRQIRDLLQDT